MTPRSRAVLSPFSPAGGRQAGGGGGVLPFDFKAYRATVTLGGGQPATQAMPPPPGTTAVTANFTVDEDITWCSQWGKVIDLTFRLTNEGGGTDVTFAPHLTWATITGIGITMSGYAQPVPMQIGLTMGDEETDSASGVIYAFEVVMADPADFRQGYLLQNMQLFSLDLNKHYYVKGNVQLIGRSYFHGGELTYDPDDFIQVGGPP